MALNPMLDEGSRPLLYPSEVIVDVQDKCFAAIDFSNGILIERGFGTAYLTNARVVFIYRDPEISRRNFALHLNLISEENLLLVQNTCIMQGAISPYANFMPAMGKFKIEIEGGNFMQFRRQMANFIKQIRMISHSPALQHASNTHQAFVDPRDPDVMIVVDKD